MKYIVYETTNLVNSKIYVGIHKTKNPDKFDGYIGCGINIYSPTFKAKTTFHKAVKKYGVQSFKRKTLAVFDTEEEASQLERTIVTVEFLKRKDVYNMVTGGKFYASNIQSKKVAQYSIDGELIKTFNSQLDAANEVGSCSSEIGKVASGKQKTCKGFVWRYYIDTPKVSITTTSLKGSLVIVQYSKVGYRMKTWKSIAFAAKSLNCCRKTISAVCEGEPGKLIAGGYQWRYETDGIQELPPINKLKI